MDDCVVWSGRLNQHGYGVQDVDGRSFYAHRLAWIAEHGAIPDGMVVMHKCDNPPCVNVTHLRLGTRTENSADMVAKGRSQKGEAHTQARLTEAQVREIRGMHAVGYTHEAIATKFGVTRSAVQHIVRYRRWKHVA
jgi:hypothetical protein